MSLPFSSLKKHSDIVFSVYRTLLRNIISLKTLDQESHIKLLQDVRKSFRSNRKVKNSLVTQRLLNNALRVNEKVVDAYKDDLKHTQNILNCITLDSPPKPTVQKQEIKECDIKTQEKKKRRRNPIYADLTDEELDEFRVTKSLSLPKSTQILLPNIHIHSKWYFDSRQCLKMKSKLDKRFINTVLPSLIAHAKQKYYLHRLTQKLNKPSSVKLRRVSGTGHWIYLINTPWNRDLRTEDFRFIGEVRKKYDELIIKIQDSEKYRKLFENLSDDEAKWEALITTNQSDVKTLKAHWSWLYDQSESLLNAERSALEEQVITFSKRQGLIYEKIKPQFEEMHRHSKANAKLLLTEIESSQIGPYTDVLDGGLGNLLKKYGFRDPVESKYLKST